MVLLARRWLTFLGGALGGAALAQYALSAGALQTLGVAVLALSLARLVSFVVAPLLPRAILSNVSRRAVLVTGCDSGFGHGAALALDAAGAVVFAGCLFPEGEGAAELRKKASRRLRVVPLDVTKDDSVAAAAATVAKELQGEPGLELWAIVNNAGILRLGEVEWAQLRDVKEVIDVNTFGPYRITQAFLYLLRKSKGRVVNVISLAGRVSTLAFSPYAMSKFACVAFTDSLRTEVKRFSVSVHSIEPWITRTPMMTGSMPILKKAWEMAPQRIKDDYGPNYFKVLSFFGANIQEFIAEPDFAFNNVVDCILDACLAVDPQTRYVPGIVGKIMDYLRGSFSFVEPFTLKTVMYLFSRNKRVK